jgi:DNA (cytosine-5)-methyltransferase 1
MTRPTVGSLCTGIGGIDLGLERAGFEIRWQCEIDPYCRKVLARHWPGVPCHPDVEDLPCDLGPVDLVAAGYPCQPFSLAGTRAGDGHEHYLWPAIVGALRMVRPGHVLLENVPGHLSLGWDRVLGDLAALGYDVEWTCIPAAAVGAPHLRWRLFAIAHANGDSESSVPVNAFSGRGVVVSDTDRDGVREQPVTELGCSGATVFADNGEEWALADAVGAGLAIMRREPRNDGEECPTTKRDGDGRRHWESEPAVGRVANGVPNRLDRMRTLGNAVVPQVAELVGRHLLAHLDRVAR